MTYQDGYTYDVFISYRWKTPYQEWVRERLAPALKNAGIKVCLDVDDFQPGVGVLIEMERASKQSRHVLCVITPEYFEDKKMVAFESSLATLRDPGGMYSTLIPFVIEETDLPDRMRYLTPIYWMKADTLAREWRKLLQVLKAEKFDIPHPGLVQPAEEKPTMEISVPKPAESPDGEELDEEDWQYLLDNIYYQNCTPIIGPGIYSDQLVYNTLINDWTKTPEYPFRELTSLALAAQFRSLKYGPIDPKGRIIRRLEEIDPPNFSSPNEPHRVLAELPFNNYLTTNYDDYLFRALKHCEKVPRRDYCNWHDPKNCEQLSVFNSGYIPDVKNPVIYHLYGYSINKTAMVVTEDDYLAFLANVSRYPVLIPPKIQEAISNSSVLLLGYSFDDWNFKILFHTLLAYLNGNGYGIHLSVQFAPSNGEMPVEQASKAKQYFKKYLGGHKIRVSWKTCDQFINELKTRWEGYTNAKRTANSRKPV